MDDLKRSFEVFRAKVRAEVIKSKCRKKEHASGYNSLYVTLKSLKFTIKSLNFTVNSLKMLIRENSLINCVLNAYLNGCVIKWEVTVHLVWESSTLR